MGTIRKVARKCQSALLVTRSRARQNEQAYSAQQQQQEQVGIEGTCAICFEEAVITTTMPCCGRPESSNRICQPCHGHVHCCPFCRRDIYRPFFSLEKEF